MNKIVVKLRWEIGGWGDKKTIVPVIYSDFVGNYSKYLNDKIKYFFKNKKIKMNFNYEDYLYKVFFDSSYGYESVDSVIPLFEKCIDEIKKIKSNQMEEAFLGIGEGYAAEIKKEVLLIYFLYDFEIYGDFSIVSLECFYKTLINWINFLKEKPNLKKEIIFECEMN